MCGHLHHSDPVSTWRTPPQPAAPTHVALIPIEGDGDRLGTITCRRSARQPCFDAEEIALLRELAGQIGLATAVDRLRESLSAEARRIVNISQRVQDVEEIERRRMALSIHDGLAQVAASVCQQLEIVTHRFAPSSDEESAELARALSLAQRTVAEARMLIAGLRPVTLDQQGLTAAIFEEIHRMRADGWSIRYVDSVSDRRYDGDIELTLYRVVQEALANIRKHAGTVPVEVVLEQRESAVHVEVRDEGPGFDPRRVARTSSEHIGLQGMSERVGHLGGTIVISSTPGHGTQVSANVPLDKEGPRG
jgi:signal transduction histidine kinase